MSPSEGGDGVEEETATGVLAQEDGPGTDAESDSRGLLLGSVHDWFASALRAVLEPEGFTVYRAHSSDEVLSFVARAEPDAVILDEGLPPVEMTEFCRLLLDGPLPRHVPLLYHFSGRPGKEGGEDVRMLQAGAWGTLENPVRPSALVAQLRRYLDLGRKLVEGTRERQWVDPETEILTLTGLMRVLPSLSNLAQREGRPMAYAAMGPTRPGAGPVGRRQRKRAADLCRRHLRRSDFVGWLDDTGGDLAVAAFATNRSGAGDLARRLNELAEGNSRTTDLRYTLSAGIVEMQPSRHGPEARENGDGEGERSAEARAKLESLQALAEAQTALRKARRAGGGIRFAEGG